MVMALVAMAAIWNAGCDVDADFSSPKVVDKITIAPEEWRMMPEYGGFGYYYCDRELHEINEGVFKTGSFQTFWRYVERRDGVDVDVQEPLPAIMHLSRFSEAEGRWIDYTETLSCSYHVGVVRFMLSRSDFFPGIPGESLTFRTVINW